MKKTLACSNQHKQFSVKVGDHKFLIGGDEGMAQSRKLKLNKFFDRCGKQWDQTTLPMAKKVAKGESIELRYTADETDAEYRQREQQTLQLVGKTADIKGAVTLDDYQAAVAGGEGCRYVRSSAVVQPGQRAVCRSTAFDGGRCGEGARGAGARDVEVRLM
ncbi:MAG TPA: hypothetical protein VF669_13725 [Tepidisphaeraceae bacterium]|jgi:hypothetical protein